MRIICSICKCSEVDPSAEPPYDGWVAVSCQHVFHAFCVNKWCNAIKQITVSQEPAFTCPICRDVWANPPRVFTLRMDYIDSRPGSISPPGQVNGEDRQNEGKEDCAKCLRRDKIESNAKKQVKSARYSMLQLHKLLRGMQRLELNEASGGQAREYLGDPVFEELVSGGLKYVKAGRQSLLKLQQQLGGMERLQLIQKTEAAVDKGPQENVGFDQLKTCETKLLEQPEDGPEAMASAEEAEVLSSITVTAPEPEEPSAARIVEFTGIRLGFKKLRDRQRALELSSTEDRDEDWN